VCVLMCNDGQQQHRQEQEEILKMQRRLSDRGGAAPGEPARTGPAMGDRRER
jgi:hypothetical protein